MRTEPCKQCGMVDYYVKGEFYYCRPCHTAAQKRYVENKKLGIKAKTKAPPTRSLEYLISLGNSTNLKVACAQGHPFSGDNVVVTSQYGRLRRRCRACERNAKRVKYGLAAEPDPVRLTDLLDT